ncbi:MAG: hypothetical protein HY397_02325 [Candidatus Doudnabacteria bacterium]|nr:hypothetical protein [Candidatus Doudnabacteria bacterium]
MRSNKGFSSLVIVIFFALVALVGYAVYQSQSDRGANQKREESDLIGDKVSVYEFFEKEQSLNSALVSVIVQTDLLSPALFSVWFDIDGDGQFSPEELGVSKVSAFAEKSLASAFAMEFSDAENLSKLLSAGRNSKVSARVNIEGLAGLDDQHTAVMELAEVEVKDWEIAEIFSPAEGHTGGVAGAVAGFASGSILEKLVPRASAQGGSAEVFNKDVPDLGGRKGKPNECVPLALSNSLIWLSKKHKFEDKLPADQDKWIDELAADVKWNKDGVKNENIYGGKEAFTARHELPLENKKIDNEYKNGESDLWKKILKELQDGEDVELILDFKQSPRGKVTKGHAVTVVGANDKDGKQNITIHDPATPEGNETYEIDRNGQVKGYPFGKVYVAFIISESFKEIKQATTPSEEKQPIQTPAQNPQDTPPVTSEPAPQPPVSNPPPTTTPQPEPEPDPQPQPQPEPPAIQEFFIEADDQGFYENGKDVNSLTVTAGATVKITFKVRADNVYFGGLDFRGCSTQSLTVPPGGTTTAQFVPEQSCSITSYWPTSGIQKDTLYIQLP